MKVLIENYKVECFETEKEYKLWLVDHQKDIQIVNDTVYHGNLYSVPQEIKNLFRENLLVSIKKQNYNDVQFILIHK